MERPRNTGGCLVRMPDRTSPASTINSGQRVVLPVPQRECTPSSQVGPPEGAPGTRTRPQAGCNRLNTAIACGYWASTKRSLSSTPLLPSSLRALPSGTSGGVSRRGGGICRAAPLRVCAGYGQRHSRNLAVLDRRDQLRHTIAVRCSRVLNSAGIADAAMRAWPGGCRLISAGFVAGREMAALGSVTGRSTAPERMRKMRR